MADKSEAGTGPAAALTVPYPGKVQIPQRRAAILRRERLIAALCDGASRRIAVVTAPPGYGKTTLLVDFARSTDMPVFWYSLDERDEDPKTFLKYFVAAGRARFPSFGDDLAEAITSGAELPATELTDLLVKATASAGTGFVLILDDFHSLDYAPDDFRAAIDGWLYRLPPDVHVVLAGRSRPQVSVLPMMEVRQEVRTITAADFAFTADEVELLYKEVLQKAVSPEDAQRLADLTEGWAGALVLMSQRPPSGSGDTAIETLRGSDTLFQYIQLEQFDPLPPDIREFLLGSAVLRSLDPAIVNELLDRTDAEDKMNFLARRNLVIAGADENAPRRYHRLFRAYLVSNLRSSDQARFRALNEKAASISEANHRWDDAVYHYIQEAAWDSIVQITDRVGSRLFEESNWSTLGDWLDAVPEEELLARPKLAIWKAKVLHKLEFTDRALQILAETIDILNRTQDWATLADALIAKGVCLRLKGEYDQSAATLIKAREILQEHAGRESAITETRREHGITLYRGGNIGEGIQELTEVVSLYEQNGDRYYLAVSVYELAAALVLGGRLANAAIYLERARVLWTELENSYFLEMTLCNLGVVYFLHGDFTSAEDVLQQGLAKSRETNNIWMIVYFQVNLADVRRESGDYPAALDMYREALEGSWAVSDLYLRTCIYYGLAETHRLAGDIKAAETASEQALAEAERSGGQLEIGQAMLAIGMVKRQQEDTKGAIDALQEAVKNFEMKGAWRETAMAQFNLAAVYFTMKKKTLALQLLESCARLVKEMGYDHFLVLEAARNPLLVQYASANKIADGFYARLLKLSKAPAGVATTEEASDEPATDSATHTVYAYALGNLRVEIEGREITDLEWRSEKSKEMFFFFLQNRGPLRKEEIVAALWPDMPEDKTTSAFHSNMYRLRKALYQDVIAKDSGRYVLDPQARFVYDVEEYYRLLQEINRTPKNSAEAIALMEKAVSLYGGSFATDFYSEWVQTLRPQLEEQHMSLLGSLAAAYSEAGDYKKSAAICQQIIELDEYNEAAWYRLMSNYIQSGNAEAARYCYQRYVKIISEDDPDETGIPDFEEIVRELSPQKRTA
jgi:LuxR family transcriptional regulator, maltose regulon positive regulatory protein